MSRQAVRLTRAWVRNPAARSRRSRSRPIAEPKTAATPRRRKTSCRGRVNSASIEKFRHERAKQDRHSTTSQTRGCAALAPNKDDAKEKRQRVTIVDTRVMLDDNR